MKKINRLIVLGGCMMCFCIALFFAADTECCYADSTAPQINSITITNADHLDAKGTMTVTMDIVEQTPGVTYFSMCFENSKGHRQERAWQREGDLGEKPFFTGKMTMKFPMDNSFMNGEYHLTYISIADGDQNTTTYSGEEEINAAGLTTIINIFNSTADTTSPVIVEPVQDNITILDPDNIDAKGYITIELNVSDDLGAVNDQGTAETVTGITNINFGFVNPDNHRVFFSWTSSTGFKSGKKVIKRKASEFGNGTYRLENISLNDKNENYTTYSPEQFGEIGINVRNSSADVTAPVINSFALHTHEFTAPEIISFDLDFAEEKYAVEVTLTFAEVHTGYTFSVNMGTYEGFRLNAGSHKNLTLPVGTFTRPGDYILSSIFIQDPANARVYDDDETTDSEELAPLISPEDRKLTIHSQFDIASERTLENTPDVIENVNNMSEGQTVLVDSRMAHVAPKALFEAIAGQNKTIVFDDEDIQWVFNGLTVQPELCKDINVQTLIRTYSGISMGFPDDPMIVAVIFKNNGRLPGPADIRINNNYIKTKFARQTNHLFFSYAGSGLPTVVDSSANIAKDNAVETTIDHNSTYTLSASKPRLAALSSASLTKTKYTYTGKALKPGVTAVKAEKKAAAAKGYSVTYKNNKNVGKASVVIQGKGIYKGKLTKTFTINPKGTSLKTLKKQSKAIKVTWAKQSAKMSTSRITGYQILLATNSKFTKGKKTVNIKGYSKTSKTVKKLKGGKKYYVKIRTYKTVSGVKYYSGWSKVKTVKTKK